MKRHRKQQADASPKAVQCIYCLRDRPGSNEHVILEGLGGTTTIPWACGPTDDGETGCNHRLGSEIDRPFLRDTPWAARRLFEAGTRSGKEHFLDRADLGGYFDIVHGVLLPQLLISDKLTLVLDDRLSVDGLERRLLPLPPRIPHVISDRVESVPTRLVIKKHELKIRASSADRAGEFERRLRANEQLLPQLLSQQSTHHPAVHPGKRLITASCEPNAPSRCAAKMVFNFVASYLGHSFALRHEMNPIRDYIAGRDVQPVETVVTPEGEVGWTMDIRHVDNWLLEVPSATPLGSKAHGLLLEAGPELLLGTVYLWGLPRFRVRVAHLACHEPLLASLPVLLATGDKGDVISPRYSNA